MSLQERLSAQIDVASLWAAARRGLAWWLGELAAMAPDGLRRSLGSEPRLWAARQEDGWRFWRDGRPQKPGFWPGRGASAVGLMLDRHEVLERELTAPAMPKADLRRMLALDMDRLSPVSPELIYFDFDILSPSAAQALPVVTMGIVQRDTARMALAAAREAGLRPLRLAPPQDGTSQARRLDFLPAVLADLGEPPPDRMRRRLWMLAALLVLINLAAFVVRDVVQTRQLRDAVNAQQPLAGVAQQLRARLATEESGRRALAQLGRRNEPLHVLNGVTQALPAGVWVERLEWNGRTLRLVGFRPANFDMEAAIRGAGLFSNPRSAPAAAAPRTTGVPFDIVADARPVP